MRSNRVTFRTLCEFERRDAMDPFSMHLHMHACNIGPTAIKFSMPIHTTNGHFGDQSPFPFQGDRAPAYPHFWDSLEPSILGSNYGKAAYFTVEYTSAI